MVRVATDSFSMGCIGAARAVIATVKSRKMLVFMMTSETDFGIWWLRIKVSRDCVSSTERCEDDVHVIYIHVYLDYFYLCYPCSW